MSLATDFIDFLNATSSITTLVGSRIAQGDAEQTFDPPYIAFRRSGRNELMALGGSVDVGDTTFEVFCVGTSIDSAEGVATAMHDVLHARALTWGSRAILGCFVTDQNDDYQILPSGSGSARYMAELFVRVFSRE